MLNRRLFVGAAASAAGMMSTAKATPLAAIPSNAAPRFAQAWSQELFRKLQGDLVSLKDASGQRFEAKLASVADCGSTTQVEQFAVGFVPLETQSLPEGLYQLAHRQAGRCRLYLSSSDQSCTALFSLLRGAV